MPYMGLDVLINAADEDLLIAGILLHDMCKVTELSNYAGAEYTKEGKMLGHITMSVKISIPNHTGHSVQEYDVPEAREKADDLLQQKCTTAYTANLLGFLNCFLAATTVVLFFAHSVLLFEVSLSA